MTQNKNKDKNKNILLSIATLAMGYYNDFNINNLNDWTDFQKDRLSKKDWREEINRINKTPEQILEESALETRKFFSDDNESVTIGNITTKTSDLDGIFSGTQRTDANIQNMLAFSFLESSVGKHTAAETSSARGVFQFTEGTWMERMKRYGSEVGIDINDYSKEDLLKLRYSSELSAYFTARRMEDISQTLSNAKPDEMGAVNGTDYYAEHFLGMSGYKNLMKYIEQELGGDETYLANTKEFRAAANANRSIFYHQDGTPRTAMELYEKLDDKMKYAYKQTAAIAVHYEDMKKGLGNDADKENNNRQIAENNEINPAITPINKITPLSNIT